MSMKVYHLSVKSVQQNGHIANKTFWQILWTLLFLLPTCVYLSWMLTTCLTVNWERVQHIDYITSLIWTTNFEELFCDTDVLYFIEDTETNLEDGEEQMVEEGSEDNEAVITEADDDAEDTEDVNNEEEMLAEQAGEYLGLDR